MRSEDTPWVLTYSMQSPIELCNPKKWAVNPPQHLIAEPQILWINALLRHHYLESSIHNCTTAGSKKKLRVNVGKYGNYIRVSLHVVSISRISIPSEETKLKSQKYSPFAIRPVTEQTIRTIKNRVSRPKLSSGPWRSCDWVSSIKVTDSVP